MLEDYTYYILKINLINEIIIIYTSEKNNTTPLLNKVNII